MSRCLAVLPVLMVAAAAPATEAGVSFWPLSRQSVNASVAYRYANGVGWRTAVARFNYERRPPYDYHLDPTLPLRIEAKLLIDGKAVSQLRMTIPLNMDRRYDVHAEMSEDDPTRRCMGCSKAVSAPIAGRTGERLWLYYGFNGISHRIIF